jgi:type II secretory pathway pseudopilin PulG
MAQKHLLIAGVMIAIAAALVFGASWLTKDQAQKQISAKEALNVANASLQNTQSDRTRLEENLQRFVELKKSRFTKLPDRLALLEAIETAGKALPTSTLEWELGAQVKVMALNDELTGTAVAQLLRIPMKLSVSGIHEEEWFAFLAQLPNADAGYFLTDSCIYDRKAYSRASAVVPSLGAVCNLSWLYVVPEGLMAKPP